MTGDGVIDAAGDDLSARIIANIERLRLSSGLSKTQLIAESGLSSSTVYAKFRRETAFTVEDLDRIAAVLAVDPAELMAATTTGAEPARRVDGAILAHRIGLLVASSPPASTEDLLDDLTAHGVPVSPDVWARLTQSKQKIRVSQALLDGLGTYFKVDPAYLVAAADDPGVDRLEAQLELRKVLRQKGVRRLGARILGSEVSADTIRAIAAIINEPRDS